MCPPPSPQSQDVHVSCTNDTDCPEGHVPVGGNGPNVGTCNITTNTCDIYAWCPTEQENENITYVCTEIYMYMIVHVVFFNWLAGIIHHELMHRISPFSSKIRYGIHHCYQMTESELEANVHIHCSPPTTLSPPTPSSCCSVSYIYYYSC